MSDSAIGKKIPSLTLPVTTHDRMTLPDDFLGRWTLLYFYPKDDTPGCTKQACEYRDKIAEFKNLDAQVVGVSSDTIESHYKFVEKFSLNFPLLVDAKKELANELELQGRDSFLIDPDGVVRHVWRKVDPTTTVEETLNNLKKIATL